MADLIRDNIAVGAPYTGESGELEWVYCTVKHGLVDEWKPEVGRLLLWCGAAPPPGWGAPGEGMSLRGFLCLCGAADTSCPDAGPGNNKAYSTWCATNGLQLLETYRRAGPYETCLLSEVPAAELAEIDAAASALSEFSSPSVTEEALRLLVNLRGFVIDLRRLRGFKGDIHEYGELARSVGRHVYMHYALPILSSGAAEKSLAFTPTVIWSARHAVETVLRDRVTIAEISAAVRESVGAYVPTDGDDGQQNVEVLVWMVFEILGTMS